jgi:hypothetical protein
MYREKGPLSPADAAADGSGVGAAQPVSATTATIIAEATPNCFRNGQVMRAP